MKTNIIYLLISFFLIACDGGGNLSLDKVTVTGVLLDSPISGADYSCAETRSTTSSDGQFICPLNSTVSFYIGGVYLGSTKVDSNTVYITPAKLYDLDSCNITDSRILNFLQFIQSLDEDQNATNGIEITQNTKNNLANINLDLSSKNTTLDDLNTTLNIIHKNLISKDQALLHYIDTLTNVLNITLNSEPYYYQQWYLEKNNIFYTNNQIDENASIHTQNLLQTYTGKGIKVAIIDNGLDVTHEDLNGAIFKTYDIESNSSNVAHSNVDEHHGTAVTGIIGARVNGKGIQGIASQVQIIFLKYQENMSDSQTIELFNKAQEFGADIINCSWGTYDVSQAVKDKIVDLSTNGRDGKGIIIVFACGNDDRDLGKDESAIPEVISVGATDKNNLRVWYSNHGENLDVVAPGGYDIGITTIDPMQSNGMALIDNNYLLYDDPNLFIGTSASAPIVSGVIALMLEKNPNITRVEIEEILHNSSDKIGLLDYKNGRNDYYGYGKVNLTNIIQELNN